MTEKKTLMVVSDAATVPTGFGRVAEAILDRLHATGKWEIKQMGINFFDEDHDKPYRIFSATGGGNFQDWIGYQRIVDLYEAIKPDVLLLFQDFWHIAEYIARLPEAGAIVTYFPVDSPNIKPNWAITQAAAAEVCTYTHFAAEEMSKAMSEIKTDVINKARLEGKETVKHVNLSVKTGNIDIAISRMEELCDPSNIHVIPHGADQSIFFPQDRAESKEVFNISKDSFVVGNVNRNQPRKRLDLTIHGFSIFAADKPDAILLLHDPVETPEGWDLAQLAQYYGVRDKVLISNQRYPTPILNTLYNACDVMINTGGGEGWGLGSMESAACGVPQIVPDWSATKEIWEGTGLLLRVLANRHETGKLNTNQCCIDPAHLAEHLEMLYNNPEQAKAIGDACRKLTEDPKYDWDNIAAKFDEILTKAANEGKPVAKEVSLR